MKILSVDSSAVSASAAIVCEDKIIGEFFCNTGLTHSQTLVPMIDALLKNTQTDITQIDALAVSSGPGSFTGVRIGVSAVKGIATALNLPCIGVSTLHAMAMNFVGFQSAVVCAVMDARCSQVYNALFRADGGKVILLCEDRAISLEQLKGELSQISERVILVGDGAKITKEFMTDLDHVVLPAAHLMYQRAAAVGMAALEVPESEYLTAEQLMVRYLRLPQAERELKKRQNT